MAVGGPFRELGRFLDECDRGERTVTAVDLADGGDPDDGSIAAVVEVSLPAAGAGDGSSLCAPELGPRGTLRFALESTRRLVPADEFDVEVELEAATVEETGEVRARLQVVPTAVGGRPASERPSIRGAPPGGPGGDAAEGSGPADGRRASGADRDLPPFKDPELLSSVYESCDTFAEMADAIDMDVTAETVRRYMIDFDIHEPSTYRTRGGDGSADGTARNADGEDESPDGESSDGEATPAEGETDAAPAEGDATEPVVLSDGIGLPEDVTADALIDIVRRSNTIYEVTRALDLEREAALSMLEELNLLDLVVGRLATEGERDISREDIVGRLRTAPGTQ